MRVRDRGDYAFRAWYFETIERNMDRIYANPIRGQRGVMDGRASIAYDRIASAFFVIISVFLRISALYFSVFICKGAFRCTPTWTNYFSCVLTFLCFFSDPCFSIQSVVRNVCGSNDTNLTSVKGAGEVIQSMPTPYLFAWVRGILFLVIELGERYVGAAICSDSYSNCRFKDITSRMLSYAGWFVQYARASRQDVYGSEFDA